MQPLTCLTIAGSDSGGGAGIQADLRTFSAFGVHGTSVVTAVTAQNTVGVSAVQVLEEQVVRSQIVAVVEDFDVRGIKTGMLASSQVARLVARTCAELGLRDLVIDPVVISSTGHVLLGEGGLDVYRNELLQYALVVTPNLSEACALAEIPQESVTSREMMETVARKILEFGPTYVLLKGGHFLSEANSSPDILVDATNVVHFESTRVTTSNDHGTGCTLSAAITAQLALGHDIATSVATAKDFVRSALLGASSWNLGRGRGPIDHLGWNQ